MTIQYTIQQNENYQKKKLSFGISTRYGTTKPTYSSVLDLFLLSSQSTILQSCQDYTAMSWVHGSYQYLAQGHNRATIRKTFPCNVYPLIPHFHIVKLGYARVYLFFLFSYFLIFAPKHRLWVLVRTASARRF